VLENDGDDDDDNVPLRLFVDAMSADAPLGAEVVEELLECYCADRGESRVEDGSRSSPVERILDRLLWENRHKDSYDRLLPPVTERMLLAVTKRFQKDDRHGEALLYALLSSDWKLGDEMRTLVVSSLEAIGERDAADQFQRGGNWYQGAADEQRGESGTDWQKLMFYLHNQSHQKAAPSNNTFDLATALRLFSRADQASAGLIYARHCFRMRSEHNPPRVIIATDEEEEEETTLMWEMLAQRDDVFAAALEALRRSSHASLGVELYFSRMEDLSYFSNPSSPRYPLSSTEALRSLISEHDYPGATTLLTTLFHPSHEDYLLLARALHSTQQWQHITTLYHSASSRHLLTEELALFALQAVSQTPFITNNEQHNNMSEGEFKTRHFRPILKSAATLTGLTISQWIESHYWDLKSSLPDRDLHRLTKWKRGTIKHNEYSLALRQYRHHKATAETTTVRNDVLQSLVRKAGHTQRHVRCMGNPLPLRTDDTSVHARREGVDLLLDVWSYVIAHRRQELTTDVTFLLKLAQGLRALRGEKECVDFVVDVAARSRRKDNGDDAGLVADVTAPILIQGVFAARMLKDWGAEREVLRLMAERGFRLEDKRRR